MRHSTKIGSQIPLLDNNRVNSQKTTKSEERGSAELRLFTFLAETLTEFSPKIN
jgi:hypothetical protein